MRLIKKYGIAGLLFTVCFGCGIYLQSLQQPRILVCMTSFKRPLLLSSQILRFQNQTDQKFDMSVSVKGAPKYWVKMMFMQEWQDMIDSGKLSVRFDENRQQLSNFLDTVRDKNLNKYDWFCEVDDDDWYSPDYIKHIRQQLNGKRGYSISVDRGAMRLRDGDKSVVFGRMEGVLTGNTMCFSRELIKTALEIDKNPAYLQEHINAESVQDLARRKEDHLLDELAGVLGKKWVRHNETVDVMTGQQYPSVMRNQGYLK